MRTGTSRRQGHHCLGEAHPCVTRWRLHLRNGCRGTVGGAWGVLSPPEGPAQPPCPPASRVPTGTAASHHLLAGEFSSSAYCSHPSQHHSCWAGPSFAPEEVQIGYQELFLHWTWDSLAEVKELCPSHSPQENPDGDMEKISSHAQTTPG